MKKGILILLISTIIFLGACSSNDTSTTKRENEIVFPPVIVSDKTPLPSYDDLIKIKKGMSYQEVYDIAGTPQFDPFSGVVGYGYSTNNEVTFLIWFSVENDSEAYVSDIKNTQDNPEIISWINNNIS